MMATSHNFCRHFLSGCVRFIGLCLILGLSACGGSSEVDVPPTSGGSYAPVISKPRSPITILVFGDSLSSGWGMTPGNDWASLLQQRIKASALDEFAAVVVVNESLAGEFAIGAVSRLPEVLARVKPTHVLLAHGTNDARTSLPWPLIGSALGDMIELSKSAGAKPLLLDITLTAYGPEVASAYTTTFKSVAHLHAVPYVGVVESLVFKPEYYDPVIPFHLNELAQPLMLAPIWAALLAAL